MLNWSRCHHTSIESMAIMTVPLVDQATLFRAAADIVVAVHVAFVAFVVLGGLLVVRWNRLAFFHLPAVIWGAFIEFAGWICPLTPLENSLRERSGSSAYEGEFIEHYVLPLLYPVRLTREVQIWLGAAAIIINVLVYWQAIRVASRAGQRRAER
jgi:hypothetical protein